jgi:uncharacterized protein YciI
MVSALAFVAASGLAMPAWFLILETGSEPPTSSPSETSRKMQEHLGNFARIHEEGRLMAVGPVLDPLRQKRGVLLYKAPTFEAAQKDLEADPFLKDGSMKARILPARVMRGDPKETPDASRVRPLVAVFLEPSADAGSEELRHLWPKQEAWFKSSQCSFPLCVSLGEAGVAGAWLATDSTDQERAMAAACRCPAVQAGLLKPVIMPGLMTKEVFHGSRDKNPVAESLEDLFVWLAGE